MRTIWIMGLAIAVALVSSANTFLPSGNGEVWSEPSNWSGSVVPDGTGVQVEIGIPTKFKKNKCWRNVHVDVQVTVGALEVTCGGCTNRLDTGDTGGDLIFDGGESAAAFSIADTAGAGLAMIDLDSPYAVRLTTDATFAVPGEVGDAEYGGILLKGLLAGNGHSLKKTGEGVITLNVANVDGAQPLDKLQVEAGTVAILNPLTVGSITKDGACRVLMSAKSSSDALASSVVCTSKMSVDNPCLFIPTSVGDETYYGGFVSPDLKKVSKCKAYVLSDAGEVLFDGRRWTTCENVELSIEDISEGYKTYKAVVPALGGETPAVSATIQFSTTAPVLGKAVETTLSSALPSASYRWVSWPACEDAAAGVEVGTGSSYVPTEGDLEHWLQVQVWQDSELVCSNKLYFSRLPVVYLTTDDGMAVTNKEYVAASLKIQGNSEFKQQYDGATQVKGRGNSSWGLYPQKSYKLKLDKKTDLFGFGKNKHWVLATSFHDRAFMRNKSASELGKALGIVGMDMTWVDVVYNGEYHGVYMLSEHLRVGENRVDIFNWDDEAESVAGALFKAIKNDAALTDDDLSALETQMDEDMSWMSSGIVVFKGQAYNLSDYGLRKDYDFSGGYLFEVDAFVNEGITRFMTPGGVNVHVDTPEFLVSNADMFNVVTSLWKRFEAAYESPCGHCADGARYTQIADLDSMVAFWLVNELMGQGDPCNSRFSFIEQGGKLTYGPIWDYDSTSAAGALPRLLRRFATLNYNGKDNWFRDWVQHQDFRTRARELYWQVARPKMLELADSLTFAEREALLAEAGAAEDTRWGAYPNPYHAELSMPTHAEDVEIWRTYILDHIAWLDGQLSTEKSFAQCLKEIYPGCSVVAYDLADGTTSSELQTIVSPNAWFNVTRPQRSGFVFAGWTVSGDVSTKAKYSVRQNVSRPMTSATLCGAESNYCAFRGLAEPGGVVCLRANWTIPGGYAIEYDLAGGITEEDFPISVAADGWLELPAPHRNGYEFAGWSLEGEIPADALFAVPGSDPLELYGSYIYGGGFESCRFYGIAEAGGFVRLKAHWSIPGGYAVEYDLDGGTAGSAYQDAIACNGWLYLKTPVKEGYEFAGWSLVGDILGSGRYSTQSGVAKLLDPATVSYGGGHDHCSFYGLAEECGVVLLRAHWTVPGGYAVEYDLAGGTAGSSYQNSIACNGWLYLKTPVKEGFEFVGWSLVGAIPGSARYSTQSGVSQKIVSTAVPYGGGHGYCSFRGLTAEA